MSQRSRIHALHAWAAIVLALSTISAADAGMERVDLELVLAVDVSDSLNRDEMLIQRLGYIRALRSPEVASAILSRGRVAITYMEWAGPRSQKIVVPWTILSEPMHGVQFADLLGESPLDPGFEARVSERGTSISAALMFAAGMFSIQGGTRIIDISGDGPQNTGGDLAVAHDQVIAAGITINGLPIVIAPAADWHIPLDVYYRDCVIGGPGAFSLSVDDASQFAEAIRRKLVLEIAGAPALFIHAGYQSDDRPPTDCTFFGQRPGR